MISPIVFPLVLFASLLALAFHFMAREARQTSFRFQYSAIAQEIAEAAANEAFFVLHQETAKPDTAAAEWIRNDSAGPLTLTLRAVPREAANMLPGGVVAEIDAVASVVDRRLKDIGGQDFRGTADARDAILTVQFDIKVALRSGNLLNTRTFARCTLIRHHDAAVISVVSQKPLGKTRNKYCQAFPLDHVLLVRDGLREFRREEGFPLNYEEARLVVSQGGLPAERRGRIFFGGTNPVDASTAGPQETPRENYVYLNVSQEDEGLVVPFSKTHQVGQNEILTLLPILNQELDKIKRKEDLDSLKYQNLKGIFRVTTVPAHRPAYDDPEKEYEGRLKVLLSRSLTGAEAVNLPPRGMQLLGEDKNQAKDPAFAESVFDGAIRKRFLYRVDFRVDMSGASVKGSKKVLGQTKSKTVPIPADVVQRWQGWNYAFACSPTPQDASGISAEQLHFCQTLPAIDQQVPQLSLISKYIADFNAGGSSGGGIESLPTRATFSQPKFYNAPNRPIAADRCGGEGFRPYGLYSLWTRMMVPVSRLAEQGVLDPVKGIIYLRGVTHINGSLELPPVNGGPWKIRGQGVLAANAFHLKAGIVRDPDDPTSICILMARRGDIIINTDQKIEASCLAFNDQLTGMVRALRPMHLKGALVCDRLGFPRQWAPGKHVLEYDPMLKPDASQHQMWVSRWITFQRFSAENRDE